MSPKDRNCLGEWQVLSQELVLSNRYFQISRYSCSKPDGNIVPEYWVVEKADSVLCVCVTKDGRVVLERQYRFPVRKVSLDFPSGSVEESDASLEEAALRELREETGYEANRTKFLCSLDKDPGQSSGKMHVVLATGGIRRGLPKEDELIKVELLTPVELLKAIDSGAMSCSFCVASGLLVSRLLQWR